MSRADTLATLETWRREAHDLATEAHAAATGDASGRDPAEDNRQWAAWGMYHTEECVLVRVIALLRREGGE